MQSFHHAVTLYFLNFSVFCYPPCKSGGYCLTGNQCHCQPGFTGSYCQFSKYVTIETNNDNVIEYLQVHKYCQVSKYVTMATNKCQSTRIYSFINTVSLVCYHGNKCQMLTRIYRVMLSVQFLVKVILEMCRVH